MITNDFLKNLEKYLPKKKKESAVKKIIGLSILLTVISCGRLPDASTSGETPTNSVSTSTPNVTSETVQSQDLNVSAKFYLTEAELPKCDKTLYRELVYVKESSQFFYCDTNWTPIDLKGAKGEAGAAGAQGVAGVNGKDGANGKDGVDGQAVSAAVSFNIPASAYVFVHPVSGVRFFLGATITSIKNGPNPTDNDNTKNPYYFCPAGSRLPTGVEYADVIRAGGWNFFHALYPSIPGFSLGVGDFKENYYGNGGLITYKSFFSILGMPDGTITHAGNFPLYTLCLVGN